ncbi:hypothetical protein BVH01_23390 [Pseudomonas sp. PA1(2017)]|uniref:hypothetical protein n=1 Tax=Pseudomonas sp. PA1(2017) TaxID=1932113 RepID=UPI0009671628|nr:hypothetical protein [Pseudomonas sp. PA1(2017)]OLU13289.1 hypothetical protein BVH01_23390 [Pseudomonas sp. PA1(2017)]
MNEFSSLEDLKRLFKEIAKAKMGNFDCRELSIDYECDLNEAFNRYAGLLCQSIKMLDAGGADDSVIQLALMTLRTHAMSLSSFFDAIADDAEFLITAENGTDSENRWGQSH